VLRAYHVAGRPSQGLTPFGRFEGWSDWVRSALVWAGEDDPCATRGRFEEIDPVTRRLRVLLQLWHERFGDTPMTLRDVVKRTETTDRNDPLYVALLEIAEKRDGAVDTRRAGRWIESKANRIADGLRVERAGARQGTALWSVSKVGSSVGVVGVVGSLHTQEENCQMTHSVVGVKPSHDSHDSHGTR